MTNPFRDNHPLTDPTILETLKQDTSWPAVRKDLELMMTLTTLLPDSRDLVTRLVALADSVKSHQGVCVLEPSIIKYLLLAADQLNVWEKYILSLQAQIMEYERLLDSPSKADPLD